MSKKINTIEKKLKLHCSCCQATYQLIVIRTDLMTDKETKCLNNCSQKWEDLLIAYCQERQIIYLVSQEQEKEERQGLAKDQKNEELVELFNQIRKQNKK